jgi:cytochrome c oxidase subunit 4
MAEHTGEPHVSNRFYVVIALILAVLTAIEVMVFYVEALAAVLLPILLVLMAVKFALVVMFFMHLRFDSRLLTGILVWGLFIAVSITLALMAVFGKFAG